MHKNLETGYHSLARYNPESGFRLLEANKPAERRDENLDSVQIEAESSVQELGSVGMSNRPRFDSGRS